MSDDNEVKTCKVVLLGESGVGKTCIISRFTNNTFEDNIMSTTGASYCGKAMTFDEYGGKTIKFEIWDTAGQEKYRALTKIFYKDALAAILVYDITRKNSFQEIKNYWYNQIKESAKNDIVIAIAANKSDLYENEQVPEDEAREYAKQIGAIFKLTSAFTSAGIEELFRAVGCKYFDPSYNDENNTGSGEVREDNDNAQRGIKLDSQNINKKKKGGCCGAKDK
jgi:small GTP-binding protein